ncbi:uncharacterized protein [Nicotiana tomentosiformis]|uniref:uncharacterized protein n=1 Tax=Nicotiana tomentosiformis TaxID=4098 RepID=UPI00388CBB66
MDGDLRESVVEVKRVNDRLMAIKLVVGECSLNVVSAYAPHAGLDEEVKRRFWEGVYGKVHRGFSFGERNREGTSLLDFAKAFELVIANSSFLKSEEHLVTFQNVLAKTQIDYLLLRKYDRGLCKDCKVIPGEILAMQHRLLVMDVEVAREVLGVSARVSGGNKGEWWWNEVVQVKVEAKKAAYLKLVGSISQEERRACMERYKVARKEAKLALTESKTAAYGRMYEELERKARKRNYSDWPR